MRTWVSLFTIQGAWNHERMLGVGTGVASLPLLRGLKKHRGTEAHRAALARASSYFNAHPYLAGMAVAAEARAELDGRPAKQIERLRCALGSPLGSLGDRLVWAGWLPASVGMALITFGLTGHWLAAVVFLVVYNVVHLGLRAWAFRAGWVLGLQVGEALKGPRLRRAVQVAPAVAAVLLGIGLPLAAVRLGHRLVPAAAGDAVGPWAAMFVVAAVTLLVLRRLMPTIGGLRLALVVATLVVIGEAVWP